LRHWFAEQTIVFRSQFAGIGLATRLIAAVSTIVWWNCYNQAIWSTALGPFFMTNVTQILSRIDLGDPTAADQLLPLVYEELKKLAAAKLCQERPGQTLQSTALVHEAYLRLLGPSAAAQPWNGRGHFFAAAAEAMRRILIEKARRKGRLKHGGDRERVDLDAACPLADEASEELIALDEALNKLAEEAPIKAELVKLRYFAGLSVEDAAAALDISPATAKRYWAYARAWLHDAIKHDI
jgi:RNA polymerase sigma factor (TIGR02999 family)